MVEMTEYVLLNVCRHYVVLFSSFASICSNWSAARDKKAADSRYPAQETLCKI